MMDLKPSSFEGSSIQKIPAEQLAANPVDCVEIIYGDSRQYQVDLLRQTCQCSEFTRIRISFPAGDLRRFCRHMVQAQSQHLESLPTFTRSLIEVKEMANSGMPNGSASAFFKIDGRTGFFGDYRDQTTYFFVEGISDSGEIFHEFVYDRNAKKWLGNRVPDSPESLLVFAFKERGKYVTKPVSSSPKSQTNKRTENRKVKESSSTLKYLILVLVAGGLGYGGYQLFKDGTPQWLSDAMGVAANDSEEQATKKLTKEEQIAATKPNDTPKPPVDDKEDPNSKTFETETNVNPSDDSPISPTTDSNELPDDATQENSIDDFIKFRTWTTVDGNNTVSAKYKSFANGKIKLIREDDGREVEIEESILTMEDRDYVDEVRKERTLRKARQFKAERDRRKGRSESP